MKPGAFVQMTLDAPREERIKKETPKENTILYIHTADGYIYGSESKGGLTCFRFVDTALMRKILDNSPVHVYDDEGLYLYKKAVWDV